MPVDWRDARGETRHALARVIDFRNETTNGKPNNRFLDTRDLLLLISGEMAV